MKKGLIKAAIAIVAIAFTTTGCVEHRYYHQNHHHTPDYYQRRHQTPPAGVDIIIHN